jgi:HlyD family secretion protein
MSETAVGKPQAPSAAGAVDTGKSKRIRKLVLLFLGLAIVSAAVVAWFMLRPAGLPPGIAGGNGRLEAKEFYISARDPARISQVLFDEGDMIEAGQTVAKMDTSGLEAQLRQSQSQTGEAEQAKLVAKAQVQVKQADYNFQAKQDARSRELVPLGAVSQKEAEIDHSRALASHAEVVAATTQVTQAQSTIDASKAASDKLQTDIANSILVSPIRGRVQRRLAEPGEVLPAGGRVFSMLDLSDVYMYVFLPEKIAGKLKVGSEARIVLDAAPNNPIKAYVSFISPMAQFTPKTVETAEERHNLTFRVKLQVPKEHLREVEPLVKTGLPGMGYVKYGPHSVWPANLQSKGPPPTSVWEPNGTTNEPAGAGK